MKRIAWVALVWLAASPAQAYIIDLNDARTVAPGTMELELQPIGYLQTIVGDEEHYLVAPSFQYYLGLVDGWDAIYTARGYVALDGDPEQVPYSWAEQFVGLRRMLVRGHYDDEDLVGPSLAIQPGMWLPGVDAETGLGASLALLFAWAGEHGTIHANLWLNYSARDTYGTFASVGYEAPVDWPVRLTLEAYLDYDDGEPYVSGLVGGLVEVSEEFALQAAVRVGGWEDYAELEVRLSSWIYWEVVPEE